MLHSVSEAFGKDPDIAYLMLFEGRRVRGGGSEIVLSQGFLEFENLIRVLINRGKRDGTFRPWPVTTPSPRRCWSHRGDDPRQTRGATKREGLPYSDEEIRSVFLAFIAGLGQGSGSDTSPTSS